MKTQIIRNKNLNIDENDVENETNIQTLQEWEHDLRVQISKVKDKILKANIDHQLGLKIDSDWYVRARGAKRVLVLLMNKIISRRAFLTKQQKKIQYKTTFEADFWRNKLKDIVDSEKMKEFCLELEELKTK